MKAWQEYVGISPQRGIVSGHYIVFRPLHGENDAYLNLLMRSTRYTLGYRTLSRGVRPGQAEIDNDQYRTLPVVLPPKAEQDAIVKWIECETAKIDELIGKQNALIELLGERRKAVIARAVTEGLDPSAQMNSTGSSWFPSIPSSWTLAPVKFGTTLIQTGPFGSQIHSSDYVDGGIALVNPSHMVNGEIVPAANVAVSDAAAVELRRHTLNVGDIVVARRGELGRAAVVTPSSAGFLCGTGSALVRLDPRAYVPSYFLAAFSSTQSRDALLEYSVGSTMDNLNADMLANLRLPCPPISEQVRIMEYLDHATSAIDDLVAKSAGVVRLLRERRSALITAAVTGKIDVRGAA